MKMNNVSVVLDGSTLAEVGEINVVFNRENKIPHAIITKNNMEKMDMVDVLNIEVTGSEKKTMIICSSMEK